MTDWFELTISPLELMARGTIIYLGLVFALRFLLRRDVGSMSMADILFVVLIADATQNGMAGEYRSITDAAILLGTLVFWNMTLDWLGFHNPRFRRLIQPAPLLPGESPMQYRATAPASSSASPLPPAQDARPDPARGPLAIHQYACGTCHVIPGIAGATATVGPPLTRVAMRGLLAGTIPNTNANLVRWLQAPQHVHRDSAMPDLGVTERDAHDIAAYLATLK